MPMYEYFCRECQTTFEALRPFSQADAAIECPGCHQPTTQRVVSRFAAISHSANGGSRMIAGSSGGCASCSSGACSTCGHG